MSFLRHEEIYRSDVGLCEAGSGQLPSPPALIGFDEFPVGYSLAGCSPVCGHGRWAKRGRNSGHNEASGDRSAGRVCNGAQERARFSSVAPSYVIRTVVTPAAERRARDPDWESLYAHDSDPGPRKNRPGVKDATKETR
jgi:hypothetical protein